VWHGVALHECVSSTAHVCRVAQKACTIRRMNKSWHSKTKVAPTLNMGETSESRHTEAAERSRTLYMNRASCGAVGGGGGGVTAAAAGGESILAMHILVDGRGQQRASPGTLGSWPPAGSCASTRQDSLMQDPPPSGRTTGTGSPWPPRSAPCCWWWWWHHCCHPRVLVLGSWLQGAHM
jgi:hypothetical protein